MLRKVFYTSFITLMLMISGCGGGGGSTESSKDEHVRGVVYDDLIVNLTYKTNGTKAQTDENGKFDFYGQKVDFYLGKVLIGSIDSMEEDKKVFLSDMLSLKRGNYEDETLIKLARLLQSLDTTKEDKKIVLDNYVINKVLKEETTIKNLNIQNLNIELVSEEVAIKHIKQVYTEQNATSSTSTDDKEKTSDETSNKFPIANAGNDIIAIINEDIVIDGSKSKDPDGSIIKFQWYVDGEFTETGQTLTISFSKAKTYTIKLVVTDEQGLTNSDTIKVTIKTKEDVNVTNPIATIVPKNGITNVSLDSDIVITFSKEINASTLTKSNIILTQNDKNLTYTKTQNKNVITLNPINDFMYGMDYTLSLENITDKEGNKIKPNPTTSTFTTELENISTSDKSVLLKTGQTESYDENGTKITNKSLKDDGFYKKGKTRSYERSSTNIITDNATKLMWQDQDTSDMNWSKAKQYCEELTLDGFDDWKLPTIEELETIVDYGKIAGKPSDSLGAINPIFEHVKDKNDAKDSLGYWSSTTFAGYLPNTYFEYKKEDFAWVLVFETGKSYGYVLPDKDGNTGKDGYATDKEKASYYVRCVRKK